MTAVILCAGVGSRIGLHPDVNKCAVTIGKTSPVRYTVKTLQNLGIQRFVIVVGHAEQSVRDTLFSSRNNADIVFIKNEKYSFHGCNYSVACGVLASGSDSERLLIVEGDSILHPDSFRQLTDNHVSAASLIRSCDYIIPRRSVVAVGEGGQITRYLYDQSHNGMLPDLSENEEVLGESMQLWTFSNAAKVELCGLLQDYKSQAERSDTAMTESGVFSINMLTAPIAPILSHRPTDWINLNTRDDLEKANMQSWI